MSLWLFCNEELCFQRESFEQMKCEMEIIQENHLLLLIVMYLIQFGNWIFN